MSDVWLSPSSLSISPAARARIAAEATKNPGEIAAVAWAFERRERVKGANDWRHRGEGSYVTHRRDAPEQALWRDGDLVFVVTIARVKIEARKASRLDVGLNGALVLI
jgi:hypothetical protein